MDERPPVAETIDWLTDEHAPARLVHHERVFGQPGDTAPIDLEPPVQRALQTHGITELYQHQVDAIQAVRNGENVVVATPTASGKSLTYTVPALERGLDDGATLYIAPFQALINDQRNTITEFANGLGQNATVDVAAQTGQTPTERRRDIKAAQPDVLLTTIDQLHLSLLPYAHYEQHWRWLFERLETIVLDEVHMYRGHLGSHASLVLRRLNRLVDHYDGDPEYVCCSATIGNPVEHAAAVSNQPESNFQLVDEDTSASGTRHYLLWNPPLKASESNESSGSITDGGATDTAGGGSLLGRVTDRLPFSGDDGPSRSSPDATDTAGGAGEGGARRSNHAEANQLFCDLVQRGYQTLVFTSSRQTAERYTDWAHQELEGRNHSELAESVYAYHAGLNDDRRQAIEAALQDGAAAGAWTTSALEIGIDIGALDAVIIDGHPGTEMSLFQRAGRAGRGEDDCLVVVVGDDNPLDQYVMRQPERLFDDDVEDAAVNPLNDAIRPDHVVCAAGDSYLSPSDEQYFGDDLGEVVSRLEESGWLQRAETNGVHWEPTNEDVHWETNLRDIGTRSVELIDENRGAVIGELQFADALRDVHPNAIYTHQKATYRVSRLDLEADQAFLERVDTNGYTRSLREKSVTVLDVADAGGIAFPGAVLDVGLATVEVSSEPTGYLQYDYPADSDPDEYSFNQPLPSADTRTTGVVLEIPEALEAEVLSLVDEETYLNGLHALEHALISLYPRAVLCDRQDIGGLSTISHPQTGRGTIFVHDAYEGGAGYSRMAYRQIDALIEDLDTLLTECGCTSGCPSCIHSPHCGNANRGLDKEAAVAVLTALLDR